MTNNNSGGFLHRATHILIFLGIVLSCLFHTIGSALTGPVTDYDSISSGGVSESKSEQAATLSLDSVPLCNNDNFADRIALFGTNIVFEGSNVGATVEPGEPAHGNGADYQSVWWTWTAPTNGMLRLWNAGVCLFYANIFEGDNVSALHLLRSSMGVTECEVKAGQTYQLAFDSLYQPGGRALELHLTFQAAPTNDMFAARVALEGTNLFVRGSTFMATLETNEPAPHVFHGRSSWWTWTAPAQGTVTISSAVNLFVYVGDSLTNLAPIAFPGTTVRFPAAAGSIYQIAALDASQGSSLTLALKLQTTVPSNDLFANATEITGTNLTLSGSLENASVEYGEPSSWCASLQQSIWWRWTAPMRAVVPVSATGSSVSVQASVFTGSSLTQLEEVPQLSSDGYQFVAEAGQAYYIRVWNCGGTESQAQDVVLHVEETLPPPFLALYPNNLTEVPGRQRGLWVVAEGLGPFQYQWRFEGRELVGQTNSCLFLPRVSPADTGTYTVDVWNEYGMSSTNSFLYVPNAGDHTTAASAIVLRGKRSSGRGWGLDSSAVWFVWRAPSDGAVDLNGVNTSLIWVYRGSASHLQNVRSDWAGGDLAHYRFKAAAGVVYWFQVWPHAVSGSLTEVELKVSQPALPASENSIFEYQPYDQIVEVGGSCYFAVGLKEDIGAVRYQWLHNDRRIVGATDSYYSIESASPADAGSYRVAVTVGKTGLVHRSGIAQLTLDNGQPPVNDNFTNATLLNGSTATASQNPLHGTVEQSEPDTDNLSGATLWWKWVAPEDGRVVVRLPFTADLRVYTGSELGSLKPEGVILQSEGLGLAIFSATAGSNYFIRVDYYEPFHFELAQNEADLRARIVIQPYGLSVPVGAGFTFDPTVAGAEPLSFQWTCNRVPIIGATNCSLTLTNLSFANNGYYRLTVSNQFGSEKSQPARLDVYRPINITQPLRNLVVNSNATVVLQVKATGGRINYGWYKNGLPLGVSSSTLMLTNVGPQDAGFYYVRIANGTFVTGSSALVSVVSSPFDINRNGETDLLLRRPNGRLTAALMKGTNFAIGKVLSGHAAMLPTDSVVIGRAHLAGFKHNSFIVRDTNNALSLVRAAATNLIESFPFRPGLDPAWTPVGTVALDYESMAVVSLSSPGQLAITTIPDAISIGITRVTTLPEGAFYIGAGDFMGIAEKIYCADGRMARCLPCCSATASSSDG